MEIHKTGFIHNPDPMSTPFRIELHQALREVIDAYEERHKFSQRGEEDSLCLRSLRTAIDGLCLEYEGRLDATTFHPLYSSYEADERLRKAYFDMLKQLRSLQKMAARKREVLSESEDGYAYPQS